MECTRKYMRTICQKCFYRMNRNNCVLGCAVGEGNECPHFMEFTVRNAFKVHLTDEYGTKQSVLAYDVEEVLELVERYVKSCDIKITNSRLYVTEKED